MTSNHSLDALNDNVLLSQFGDLVLQTHEGCAQLLRHIEVIDRRKLWAELGYSSLFSFLVGRYHMSESTAGKRMGAARAARRFPITFEMVARGEIHLSGIHRLKAHLTPENHVQVLAEAKHKTIREIEELVARLAPQPDVPTTLRALPNRTTATTTTAASTPLLPTLTTGSAPAPNPPPRAPSPPPRAAIPSASETPQPAREPLPLRRDPAPAPLSPGRYKLTVTISESTRGKLDQLQDLLAHKIKEGDLALILDRALDALLTEVHKQKTGIGAKPRAAQAPQATQPRAEREPQAAQPSPSDLQTRHLTASARREVWSRDQGRCGFVGSDGHRCNETRGLQFAHKEAWAKGGANPAENVCLRCPAHNALEADRDYGTRFMANKRKQKPLKVREPLARYILNGEPRAPLVDAERSQHSSGDSGDSGSASFARATAVCGRRGSP